MHTKKDGGMVEKRYTDPILKKSIISYKKPLISILTFFAIVLLIVLFSIIFTNFTGKTTLQTQPVYAINAFLSGQATITLQEGDSIQKDTQIELVLLKDNMVLAETTKTFEEFLGNQIDYVPVTNESISCVNITTPLVQEVCTNETVDDVTSEICTNQTSETIEENCTTTNVTDYYYQTPGSYSVDLHELLDYKLIEQGDYVLRFDIPNLNVSSEATFNVALPAENETNKTGPPVFVQNAGAVNISGCETINLTGSYVLNQSISSSGTCITINNNSITLDCQGYSITGDGTTGDGVDIFSYNFTVLKNCTIENFSRGVYLSASSGDNITSNSILATGGSAKGILLDSTSNNNAFFYNSINTSGTGDNNLAVEIDDSNGNTFISNNISANGTGSSNSGVTLSDSNDSTFISNIIVTNGNNTNMGISMNLANNNTFVTNNIAVNGIGNWNYGLNFWTSSNYNNFTGNSMTTSCTGSNACHVVSLGGNPSVGGSECNDNIFVNNTIFAPTADSSCVWITGSHRNSFDHNTLSNCNGTGIFVASGVSGSSYNNITNNIIQNNLNSGITLYNLSNNNLIDSNNITNNGGEGINAYLNSSNNRINNNTIFNNNTGISFDNSPDNNVTSNSILATGSGAKGIWLDSNSNNNSVSYNQINTSGIDNYNSAVEIDGSNGNTFISNNMTPYGTGDANYGVSLYDSNDSVFVSNIISTDGNNSNNGFMLVYASNNTFVSNSVTASGVGNSNRGMVIILSSSDNNVTSNLFLTKGNGWSAGWSVDTGIEIQSDSNNNLFYYNNINTSGTGNFNSGVSIWAASYGNTFISNNISANGTGDFNYGVDISSNDSVFISNIIVTDGASFNNGFLLDDSNNNELASNTITAAGTGATSGIYLRSNSNNNTISGNIANNNPFAGIYTSSGSNNNITNNTANSNFEGIYLDASSDNNLVTSNTANNNSDVGVYLTSSSNNNISNNNVSLNGEGIWLESGSDNNIITNNTANFNAYGVYVLLSSNNILTKNTANSNSVYGFTLDQSSNDILINNNATDNVQYDLNVYAASDSQCNNVITNLTGSGNRPILYYNGSVNLQNQTVSELILCNADYSDINNVTIEGSATLNNNGFYALRTDWSNFTAVNSSDNNEGAYIEDSINNIFNNSVLNSNMYYGMLVQISSSNIFTNNNFNSNGYYGIGIASGSNNNIFANDNANSNTLGDFRSRQNILNNNNSVLNLSLINQNVASFVSSHQSNFVLKGLTPSQVPAPTLGGYTSLGKYFSLTGASASNSQLLNISYSDSDIGGGNESTAGIWRYTGTTWTDTGFFGAGSRGVDQANNVVYANITTAGTFGVFAQGPEGGGGGGGVPTPRAYTITEAQFLQGYTAALKVREVIWFDINGEWHSLTVNNIGANFADVAIESSPISLRLLVGDSIKLHLTQENYYDLYVKLESINADEVDITIKSLNESIAPLRKAGGEQPEGVPGEKEKPTPMEEGAKNVISSWLVYLLILFILVIGVVLFIVIRKKKTGENINTKAERDVEGYISEGLNALRAKNLSEARKYYELLRAYYDKYEDQLSRKERNKLYQTIIDFYNQITIQ
jgi:parallel beta-helix repeat protein